MGEFRPTELSSDLRMSASSSSEYQIDYDAPTMTTIVSETCGVTETGAAADEDEDIESGTEFVDLDTEGVSSPPLKPRLPPTISAESFESLSVLGVGSFGKVVLARHQASDQLFAVKLIPLETLKLQKQLEHTFIMKLHYAYRGPGPVVALVFEYCAGGELFHHLSKRRVLDPRTVAFYTAELALALQYVHDRGVAYRDVKPENCLLDHHGHLKLGDFGLAKIGCHSAFCGMHSLCGTPEYMAPEILVRKPSGYGSAVDWWGVGIWMYELLVGLPPWRGQDRHVLFDHIRAARLRLPPSISPQAASCVASFLRRNPRKRLCAHAGVHELKVHAFLADIDFDSIAQRDPPIAPCDPSDAPSNLANFDVNFTSLPTNVFASRPANSSPCDPATLAVISAGFDDSWDFVRQRR